MKQRSAIIVALLAVVSMSILSSLAVLPHGHEGRFSHEGHEGCAVKQVQDAHLAWGEIAFYADCLFFAVVSAIFFLICLLYSYTCYFGALRAPPASL